MSQSIIIGMLLGNEILSGKQAGKQTMF